MPPRVYNMHWAWRPRTVEEGGTAIYIGRPSKWGNPYPISPTRSRFEAIERYRNWLDAALHEGRLDLSELTGHDLICYCKPAACHGDTLLLLANPIRQQSLPF